ncbi:hypothetical protein LDL59_06595 [Kaistella anthropi]|nr:hypothetical protein [Kaistella anthropi]
MEKNMQLRLQELIFSSSNPEVSREISKMENKGIIRKIAPRIYTSNLEESAAKIIQRNIFQILGNLYPGAVLSHRSALEFKPTEDSQIFLTYSYSKKLNYQGITLIFFKENSLLREIPNLLVSSMSQGNEHFLRIFNLPERQEDFPKISQLRN